MCCIQSISYLIVESFLLAQDTALYHCQIGCVGMYPWCVAGSGHSCQSPQCFGIQLPGRLATGTGLCCFLICSLPVSSSLLWKKKKNLILHSVALLPICSTALLQDCFWHCPFQGNAKPHHLQDISLFTAQESSLGIRWNSLWDWKLFTFINADVLPICP